MSTLVSDRFVDFALYEVLDGPSLCELPAYSEHSRETFDMVLTSARKLARDLLAPAYRVMDQEPPRFEGGKVLVHPRMRTLLGPLSELDLTKANRPVDVGGMSLPSTVATLAMLYSAAANLSAASYFTLTSGAANLIETFGSEPLKQTYASKMHACEWLGTMALTEPQAGSSLSDVATTAEPDPAGFYRVRGAKIFISGGDQDLTENVVHLLLGRIAGAPSGTKGISLFVVPKRRVEGDALVANDVHTTGVLHKLGWRGLPSVALSFGDEDDCRGWLVGEPHQGLRYMFQMMNEARILVGLQAAATASAAYHVALDYARTRPQGRPTTSRDPAAPQIPILEHADVRRMLLRQKAIAQGSILLVARTAKAWDLAHHATDDAARKANALLLDVLTPLAKTFPAERGFEATALAVQVHGGYGYTSEYAVEAYLRDQKLNTIHEGTSGIQSLDLLGRKVMAGGGDGLRVFVAEVTSTLERARAAGVQAAWCGSLAASLERLGALTLKLGALGMAGDVEGMLLHSADYLELMGILAIAWQWLDAAAAAKSKLAGATGDDRAFYDGVLAAAQYWIATELPRTVALGELCASGEDSYARVADASW